MAGASVDDEDNPVGVNVVPLIDVIFCLCIFFMCSFRFKQLEGKFESWLPKNKGDSAVSDPNEIIAETRVAMEWSSVAQKTTHMIGNRVIEDMAELQRLIKESHDDHARLGKEDAPVIIDADPRIPMRDIIEVVNLCRRERIDNIEFALALEQDK